MPKAFKSFCPGVHPWCYPGYGIEEDRNPERFAWCGATLRLQPFHAVRLGARLIGMIDHLHRQPERAVLNPHQRCIPPVLNPSLGRHAGLAPLVTFLQFPPNATCPTRPLALKFFQTQLILCHKPDGNL
jgi:hypothetical protein